MAKSRKMFFFLLFWWTTPAPYKLVYNAHATWKHKNPVYSCALQHSFPRSFLRIVNTFMRNLSAVVLRGNFFPWSICLRERAPQPPTHQPLRRSTAASEYWCLCRHKLNACTQRRISVRITGAQTCVHMCLHVHYFQTTRHAQISSQWRGPTHVGQ